LEHSNGYPLATWALLSAIFAALTAIFAKVGVENINSDFATFIRSIVILVVLAAILFSLGEFESLGSISGRTYFFLVSLLKIPSGRGLGNVRGNRRVLCRDDCPPSPTSSLHHRLLQAATPA
jgi:hypothetical protein